MSEVKAKSSGATAPELSGCPVAHWFNPNETGSHKDPFAWYKGVRDEDPVFFAPAIGMYVAGRYKEITEVLKDPVTYSNRDSLGADLPVPDEILQEAGDPEWRYRSELVLTLNDPPQHTRLRRLLAPPFTPRRMSAFAPIIREVANARIDEFADRGKADLTTEFAYRIPNMIIARIMGADAETAERFVEWTEAFLRTRFVEEPEPDRTRSWRMVLEQDRYSRKLIAERRQNPQNDLMSDLIAQRTDDGRPALTEEELVAAISSFIGAGSETSAIMMVHTMYLLLTHPEQFEEVRADPEGLLPNAIEEALRLRGPVRGLVRIVVTDTELGGVKLPAGSRLYINLSSANHDEEIFPEPERFDIHRPEAREHLAFGRWAHFCVGAPLARLEGEVALRALIERLPQIRLAPEQDGLGYVDNLVLPSVKSLAVEWD